MTGTEDGDASLIGPLLDQIAAPAALPNATPAAPEMAPELTIVAVPASTEMPAPPLPTMAA